MIVPLQEADDKARFGAKACHLGRAIRAGLPVPPGYALSVESLQGLQDGEPAWQAHLDAILRTVTFPVAARSSAIGEDAGDASFAGQHVTALNLVSADAVMAGLRSVYASASTDAALAYRRKRGIATPIEIAAVVQQLINPQAAGVLFTRNPLTGASEFVIEGAWGLGEVVVSGLVTPDHVRAARDGTVLEMRIGDKHVAALPNDTGGTDEVETPPERADILCLSPGDIARLCDLAHRCEAVFGPDLDLEWAVTDDAVWLLQSRPITTRFPG